MTKEGRKDGGWMRRMRKDEEGNYEDGKKGERKRRNDGWVYCPERSEEC